MMRYLIRGLLLAAGIALTALPAFGQGIKLVKQPHYHKGKIVFSYLGDLWRTDEDGSNSRRLTVHTGRDTFPRFSPDGKWIAFSSSRYGGTDVFIIPAEGGKAKRLTWHTAGDTVVGWSQDSKRVMFSSARGVLYPMGIPNLYEVPITGGLEKMIPTDWGAWGSYSPDGTKLAFNRHPARWWRRHYRGSYAADLWVADLQAKKYRRIVDNETSDPMKANNLWPMYGRNGFIYFVSDRELKAKAGSDKVMQSTRNIWKVDENGNEPPVQVTHHDFDELFYPSMSSDGRTIVYEGKFGLWKLDVQSGKTREIQVEVRSGDVDNNIETITYNSEADSYDLSPSGKRAVIAIHGELFSIPTGKGATRRLTGTPHVREGSPRWSPNGKHIAFIGNQRGQEDLYICDERGQKLKKLTKGTTEKGTFVWSPDSKSILFATTDFKLKRLEVATGEMTVLAESKVSSLSDPQWSPDGKWISFVRTGDNFLPHVYIMASTGGKERRITDDTSHQERLARWTADGKYLVYLAGGDVTFSRRGGGRPSTGQLYSVPLVPMAEDPYDDDIDSEAEAMKAAKKKAKELISKLKGKGKGKGKGPAKKKKVEVKIDFAGIADRAVRLTQLPDAITSVEVTPDGETVVFVTTSVEGGRPVRSIYKVAVTGGTPSRVAQSGASTASSGRGGRGGFGGGFSSLQFTKDGRKLYYRSGKSIYSMSFSGASKGGSSSGRAALLARLKGGSSPSSSSSGKKVSFTAKVQVDHRRQRQQVFQEAWFVMKHRFYDAGMHGVEWDNMLRTYEPLLDHCGSRSELHAVVNMMLGELNASHTGISGGGSRGSSSSSSGVRYPGFELEADQKSGYYRVSHIYKRGPADKGYIKLNVGDYILALDSQPLKAGDNYYKAYADIADSRFTFTVNSKPNKEGARIIKIKPTSSLSNLQYQKWVDERREKVTKLSKGQVGYLHIRQMSGSALTQFEKDLAALQHKKALIIDQRFNPGGNIDQELLQILQQKVYQLNSQRGSVKRTRPMRGYFGPMVVMANERSTSDAEVFPDGFRTLGLGKIVGVTTYGAVIGTGSYRLMDGSSIRTPGMGLWNVKGTNLENYGVPPDVYVDNSPEDFFAGRDRQLQVAVEVLLKQLNAGQ